MEVKIQKLHERFKIPTQASLKAGGWDVVCTEIEHVNEDFVICWLGFAMTPPDGYKITLVPRSNLTKSKWVLQNSPCLGDSDFIGQYSLRFRCIPNGVSVKRFEPFVHSPLNYTKFPYEVGDRVGQIYLEEVIPMEFTLVESLESTERGDGGWGSTGLK